MPFVAGPVPIVQDPELQSALNLVWSRLQDAEVEIGYFGLDELNEPPDQPIEGMTVFADGANWDPGSGRGIYRFDGAVWEKI